MKPSKSSTLGFKIKLNKRGKKKTYLRLQRRSEVKMQEVECNGKHSANGIKRKTRVCEEHV